MAPLIAFSMVLWYNGIAPEVLVRGMDRAAFAGNATPGFSRHSFPGPNQIEKKVAMGIRSSMAQYKEAPRTAMKVAMVAILIASLAMLVALSKKG